MTTNMVAAYVTNNPVPPSELRGLIQTVHTTLLGLSSPSADTDTKPVPAVPIKKSVTPDYIVCLDDGQRFKSLKRHLGKLGMTPDEYRTKWGLPATYPMTAPQYAAKRVELAKSLGLGNQRRKRRPKGG
jgi:predicted transcriptional regulator